MQQFILKEKSFANYYYYIFYNKLYFWVINITHSSKEKKYIDKYFTSYCS